MRAADATTRIAGWSADDLEVLDACPACGSGAVAVCFDGLPDLFDPTDARWRVHRCRACESLFMNPRPAPHAIGRVYEAAAYYTHEAVDDRWPATRGAALRERLLKGYVNARYGYRFRPATALGRLAVPLIPGARGMADTYVRGLQASSRGRLLDVGCGNGTFLLRMQRVGWEVEGIEPDPAARAHAAAAGLAVRDRPLDGDVEEGRYDAITMNHVIEHLHDPPAVLRECRRALRPGGTIWIATPNARAAGRIRYGGWWVPLDPPRHLVLFTAASLRRVLADAGFEGTTDAPPTLTATRWTYRVSHAYRRGDADPYAAALTRRDLAAAVAADIRTLRSREHGEELIVMARKPRGR